MNKVKCKDILRRLSPFHFVMLAVSLLALIFFFFSAKLGAALLLLFGLLCAAAPFMTRLSFFLPVISRGHSGEKAVALTFDDGPDPDVTPLVLKILSGYSAKATFFVTGKNALQHPGIIRDILLHGHSIGNHSYSHDPLLMLRTSARLYNEIKSAHDILKEFGITAYAFRPPAGITNPRLRRVLLKLDLFCVNWSARAFDAGNRRIDRLAGKILAKVKPDDIILLHDVSPPDRNDIKKLIREIELVLDGLKKAELSVVPLSEITGREVMRHCY